MRKRIRRTWRGWRWLERVIDLVRERRTKDRRTHYAETGSFEGTAYDCGLCAFSSPDKNERDKHERDCRQGDKDLWRSQLMGTWETEDEVERIRESDYDASVQPRYMSQDGMDDYDREDA